MPRYFVWRDLFNTSLLDHFLFYLIIKRILQHMRDINFIHICVLLINTTHPADWEYFLVLQNGLEECCKAVAKRQIDGDELLVNEYIILLWGERLFRALSRFSSHSSTCFAVNMLCQCSYWWFLSRIQSVVKNGALQIVSDFHNLIRYP